MGNGYVFLETLLLELLYSCRCARVRFGSGGLRKNRIMVGYDKRKSLDSSLGSCLRRGFE